MRLSQATATPALVSSKAFLEQKIRVMALIELVFTKDAHSRTISFAEIAKTCESPLDQVELLLMKGFSLGVLKGTIDQVDAQVRIKWVQPRVLDMTQIGSIRDKLKDWSSQVRLPLTSRHATCSLYAHPSSPSRRSPAAPSSSSPARPSFSWPLSKSVWANFATISNFCVARY